MKTYLLLLFVLFFCLFTCFAETINLTNVSYDPTRELYKDINKIFIEKWSREHGDIINIQMSHGGSGKQARSVMEGLEADVVTLALAYDIDMISKIRGFLPQDWQKRLPNNSCPYTSTIVFLVRKGNPKNIRSWEDLIRPDVQVITSNPKTSGGARWCYLACWGYAYRRGGLEKAREFVKRVYKNVPVLDTGARGSTNTFLQGIGDVLLSWENEAFLAIKETQNSLELISPGESILAEPPVAVVDKYAEKHKTKDVARAYLEFLYSDEAQNIIVKHYYRCSNSTIFDKYKDQFPEVKLFRLEELYPGGWDEAHKIHFSDGGIFDQIMLERK
ncbi:MAG TPA: sulfate ABC transporter substrate-binding protein [Candidatus Hydrogenedens sp.]|nr:sulfate ABC transporter substrate-binding protein [Candidatus Hydrogenedens sp.]HOL21171.1 sulfate ABC transporter substrate-binding protein [Candidatus Hydrogenedens sp.]HPP59126.1 sulfate ABC transporter substrate-binding protein [Candidatus Hydrogenedens sp.]